MRLVCVFLCTICAFRLPAAEIYPLEYFAQRDTISSVRISPNGEKMGLFKIATKDGNPVLEIFQTKDLGIKPFRIDAKPMELVGFSWLSDEDILLNLRQKVRDKIDGFNQGVYEGKLAKLDLRTNKIREFKEINARVINLLPNDPEKIIIAFNADAPKGSKVPSSIRPAKYYELDLVKGTKKLILIGKIEQSNYVFDGNGHPRISTGFDLSKRELVYYYKRVGDKDWTEIYRLSEDSFERFSINGLDDQKPDHLFVTAHNGNNTTSLWEFNAATQKFGERIYGRTDVDVLGTLSHTAISGTNQIKKLALSMRLINTMWNILMQVKLNYMNCYKKASLMPTEFKSPQDPKTVKSYWLLILALKIPEHIICFGMDNF